MLESIMAVDDIAHMFNTHKADSTNQGQLAELQIAKPNF